MPRRKDSGQIGQLINKREGVERGYLYLRATDPLTDPGGEELGSVTAGMACPCFTPGAQLQHRTAGNLGCPEARSLTCPSLLLDRLKPGMIEQNSLRSYLQAVWLPGSTRPQGIQMSCSEL